ncbi:MAG: hypothetical protein K0S53_114 [Bacteroidetes bacterium]|jgi:hypothetical protein|nr:hypothetical protein [Bacteroidota bacterium]MDF2452293.1 hypothetical protein [Bacteroidota bacterium]
MKLYILICAFAAFTATAQSVSYKESLKKNIRVFESSNSAPEFIKSANEFETMALSEKKEWLPFYYAGLCNVLAAFQKPKPEIDALCDKAEGLAHKADSLSKNNSEVLVLRSMIAAARINVNQAKRGQKYGMMARKFANEAVKLNDANPRAYFVKAQATLYTPAAFGGGEKKAKPIFELVLEKAKTFKPESNLHPTWGKTEADQELKKINNKQK